MDEITLPIKAEIDSSDVDKDLSKVADQTAKDAKKAYDSLMNSVTKSFSEMKSNLEQLKAGGGISDIYEKATKAVEIYNSEVGKLKSNAAMDPLTTKLYNMEHELANVAKQILTVQTKIEDLNRASAIKINLEEKFGGLKEAEKYLDGLKAREQELFQTLPDYKRTVLPDMSKQLADIEQMKASLRELFQERQMLLSSGDTTEATASRVSEINSQIQSLNQNLMQASKAFYALGRESGFGKINSDIVQNVKTAEEWLSVLEEIRSFSKDFRDASNVSTLEGAPEQLGQLSATFDMLIQRMNEVVQHEEQIRLKADEAGYSFANWRNVVWSCSRVLGNIYTIGLDVARTAKTVANIYKQIWSYISKAVTWLKTLRSSIKGTAADHAKSFGQMLKDLLRYSFGIRSLFALFRRLRKYIKEAFEAMADQVPEVNKTLSEIVSSFNQVKGSLATALEPIISAISSGLIKILELFSKLLTYIGMFFAALTGRSYVYQANKSMTDFAASTGKAAKNAKDLNKQLQKFDELNNLTTKDKNDSGGGGSAPLANYQKVGIPDWLKNLADIIKGILQRIWDPIKRAWDKMKDYVINAWKRAIKSVGALLLDILRDFLRAWDKWGEPIFLRIFKIVGDIGHIIANIADKLREAWNANDNGYKIWCAILEIIYKIVDGISVITEDIKNWTATINLTPAMTAFREWLESLVPVAETLMGVLFDIWDKVLKRMLTWTFDGENSGIARFFRILRDFNKKVNWAKLRDNLKGLWDAIGQFGETVGEGLLMFISGLSDSIANWVNSSDFERLLDKIRIFLGSISPRDIKDDLNQVLRIVKNLVIAVFDVIKTVWSYKDKILDVLEWISKHIKGIITAVIMFKSVIDISRLVMNIYLLVGSLQKVGGAISIITTAVEFLLNPIGLVLTAVSLLAIGFGGAIKSVKDEYDKFTENLSAYNKINEDIKRNIDERQNSMSDLDTTKQIVHDLVGELDDLQSNTDLTVEQQTRQKEIVDQLNGILPDLNLAIDDQTGKLNLSTEAILANADAMIEQARVEAAREDLIQIAKDQYEAEKNLYNQKKDLKEAQDEYNAALEEYRQNEKDYAEWGSTAIADGSRWEGAKAAVDSLNKSIEESEQLIKDLDEEYTRTTGYINEYTSKSEEASQKQSDIKDRIKETNDELDRWGGTLEHAKASTQQLSDSATNLEDATESLTEYSDAWTNLENIDYSGITSSVSDFGTTLTESMPEETDWSTYGADVVNGISSGIEDNTSIATTAMQNLATSMVTAFHDSDLRFGSPSDTMYDFGLDILNGLNNSIEENQDSTVTVFNNFATVVVDACTNMRNSIIDVFSGLADDMSTILTNIAQAVANTFNDVADSLTDFKTNLNTFTGGMNTNYHVNIPKLATGAVIPPNNEFLAVLGDQKHGTNIESPLSTMVEAFNMANKGGSEAELALLQEQNDLLRQLLQKEFGISENAIFNSVRKQNSIYTKSNGVSAFA